MRNLHVFTVFSCLFCAIYTAKAQQSINASEIIAQIDRGEDIIYKGAKITGDLLFIDAKDKTADDKRDSWGKNSDKEAYICHIRSAIQFENCTFTGEVRGYLNEEESEELYNANFYKEVIFRDCIFKEDVNFKYSKFPEATSFEGSTFEDEAFFKYSFFGDETSFADVDFEGEATFKYTEFPHSVSFKQANFRDDANFKYTKFPQGTNFASVVFHQEANFKYAKFRSPSNFKNTDFGNHTNFKYTKIDGRVFTSYLLNNRN